MAPGRISGMAAEDIAERTTILFDQSKNEKFVLGKNLRVLERKLKAEWKIEVNKDEITGDVLSGVGVLVLAGPQGQFTGSELESVKAFLESKGSGRSSGGLLVMLGEGGERSFSTNINYLIEEYGIMVNNDAVVRTHYYKYFHPKECLVSNGVVHGCVPARLGLKNYDSLNQCLSFVYPFGATLNTAKPAVAVLSTGSVSLPLARPVCAFATAKNGGRIAVIGSGHVFTDHYIDKEDNLSVANLVFDFLTAEDFVLDPVDAKEIEIYDYTAVADTAGFAERLRCCLLETTEELPTDTGVLFNSPLYSLDLGDIVPDIVRAYDILNLKHEPLGLIPPEFNIPLPRLKMAVYPPVFRDPADPPLELFDLEEEFSDDQNQLAEAANRSLTTVGKTTETVAQVEEFIDTCASILGLAGASTPGEGRKNPFDVLYEVAAEISEFKKNLNKHE